MNPEHLEDVRHEEIVSAIVGNLLDCCSSRGSALADMSKESAKDKGFVTDTAIGGMREALQWH
jgi:hypothetical protein